LAHLRTLQALPDVGAILLWDESAEALARLRQSQGEKVVAASTDLPAVLAHPGLLFAIAAQRNDRGPAIFNHALTAGCHLLAEKPIGRTAAETAQVMAVAERNGRQLGVCYQNRAVPAYAQARALVAEGLIGPLVSIELRMITTQVARRNPAHWLFNRQQAGGGILSWLGCHYLDLLRYISGDEVVSVMAEVATGSGEAIDVEDVAVLSLRLASGAVASLHAGYLLALSGGGYFNRGGYDNFGGFSGRLGRLSWLSSGPPAQLLAESTHPSWAGAPWRSFDYRVAESPAYGGVAGEQFVRQFIRAALGQGRPAATGHDAFQVARIVDAAYESSQTGRRIAVAPPAG
jgi:predicted dehydrogenase